MTHITGEVFLDTRRKVNHVAGKVQQSGNTRL